MMGLIGIPLPGIEIGIALATAARCARYVPIARPVAGMLEGAGAIGQREVLDRLRPVFEDPAIAKIGHDVKSRARENYILYNRISDGPDGTASYEVDLPNGGLSYLIGKVIQQGPRTDNNTIVSYGAEA
jgi:hypothetical protein